jgi:hypothetical protein
VNKVFETSIKGISRGFHEHTPPTLHAMAAKA